MSACGKVLVNRAHFFVALFSIVINVTLLLRELWLLRMAFAEYYLPEFVSVLLSMLWAKTYFSQYDTSL